MEVKNRIALLVAVLAVSIGGYIKATKVKLYCDNSTAGISCSCISESCGGEIDVACMVGDYDSNNKAHGGEVATFDTSSTSGRMGFFWKAQYSESATSQNSQSVSVPSDSARLLATVLPHPGMKCSCYQGCHVLTANQPNEDIYVTGVPETVRWHCFKADNDKYLVEDPADSKEESADTVTGYLKKEARPTILASNAQGLWLAPASDSGTFQVEPEATAGAKRPVKVCVAALDSVTMPGNVYTAVSLDDEAKFAPMATKAKVDVLQMPESGYPITYMRRIFYKGVADPATDLVRFMKANAGETVQAICNARVGASGDEVTSCVALCGSNVNPHLCAANFVVSHVYATCHGQNLTEDSAKACQKICFSRTDDATKCAADYALGCTLCRDDVNPSSCADNCFGRAPADVWSCAVSRRCDSIFPDSVGENCDYADGDCESYPIHNTNADLCRDKCSKRRSETDTPNACANDLAKLIHVQINAKAKDYCASADYVTSGVGNENWCGKCVDTLLDRALWGSAAAAEALAEPAFCANLMNSCDGGYVADDSNKRLCKCHCPYVVARGIGACWSSIKGKMSAVSSNALSACTPGKTIG